MKKHIIGSLVCLAALSTTLTAHARLEKGTQELGVQGSLDLDAADDYQLKLDLSYGYFMYDDVEVGAQLGVSASDSYKNLDLGGFVEYNFNNESRWVPFIGAAAAIGSSSFSDEGSDLGVDLEDATAFNVDLSLGVKAFINDNVAVSGKFIQTFSTDDIHFDGEEAKDSASSILIGTRFYF